MIHSFSAPLTYDDSIMMATDPSIIEGPKSKLLFIGGVPIQFPWTPYSAQLMLMSKTIEAIKNGQNALLESPTGSGEDCFEFGFFCRDALLPLHDYLHM